MNCENPLIRWEQERAQQLKEARANLRAKLIDIGASEVCAEYDSGGDEGNIEDWTLEPGELHDDPTKIGRIDDQEMCDFLWQVATTEHPGFEDGDGAFGDIRWSVEADTIKLVHHSRFVDHRTFEHEAL